MGGGVTEQWLNWVNYYSLYCLHRILPSEHIECWRLLVLSSRTLCKPFLSRLELALAKGLMSRFCERFESLYGSNSVTPNLHMHSHLADCSVIMDSYILFGYLAMNAIMASSPSNEPSNNRSIELQLLKMTTCVTSYFIIRVKTMKWVNFFWILLLGMHKTPSLQLDLQLTFLAPCENRKR